MGVLDRRHGDVGVLVDFPDPDIVTEEQLADRDAAAAVGDPDVGADREVLHRSLDQVLGLWRAVDIDGRVSLVVPCDGHQGAESGGVIVMVVRDEDRPDVAHVEPGLGDAACSPIAGVDDVQRAVDDQQVGGLGPGRSRRRPRNGTERDHTGAGLRGRVAGLGGAVRHGNGEDADSESEERSEPCHGVFLRFIAVSLGRA